MVNAQGKKAKVESESWGEGQCELSVLGLCPHSTVTSNFLDEQRENTQLYLAGNSSGRSPKKLFLRTKFLP